MRSLFLIPAAIIFLLTIFIAYYAPYLPALLYEGYPEKTWSGRGDFVQVEGALAGSRKDSLPRAMSSLPPNLRRLAAETGTKAFLVSHKGEAKIEYYSAGFSAETRFNSFSMVKSLVGLLVLKAVEEKKLSGLDQPAGRYLGDIGDSKLQRISLRELLLMQVQIQIYAGLPFTQDHVKDLDAVLYNPFGPMARLHGAGLDEIAGSLTADPRSRGQFRYQNVITALLGRILERAYEKPLAQLLSEKIWKPAGAEHAKWRRPGEGQSVSAYCCLYATAQDWLRIGKFLNRNGAPGQSFLPDRLWRNFMGLSLSQAKLRSGVYGMHIRHDILDRKGKDLQGAFAYMLGQSGQILYLMPERDLVVLRFGDKMQLLHTTLYEAWDGIAH